MKRVFPVAIAFLLLYAAPTAAGERSVELAVDNMTCVGCPYIVRKTLEAVPGVVSVDVSFERKRAFVTFDDAETNVRALTDATGANGYPARPVESSKG